MKERLTIWTDLREGDGAAEIFARGVEGHEIVRGGIGEAEVAFGQPKVEEMLRAGRLKWVHITSAGYTTYDRAEVWEGLKEKGVAFTNSSGVFDEACAESLMGMMMGANRLLPVCVERQVRTRGWREDLDRGRMRLLRGQSVVMYGYGAIGRCLARMLGPFGMEIVGVRRRRHHEDTKNTKTHEKSNRVEADEVAVVTPGEAEGMLGRFDHVVNILPASGETEGFFDAVRFGKMKRGVYFYNIGRGATVVQEDLVAALESGQVGAAYLDVTSPEPLPSGDPLWTAKNCWITPHIGGGYDGERERMVEHFLGNLRRFEKGEGLRDRVV